MSSFRKKGNGYPKSSEGNSSSSNSSSHRSMGVRQWSVSSLGLVSSGHREFDEILGGGVVLGSSMLVLEDSISDYGITMLRYQMVEAVSMKHQVVILLCSPWDSIDNYLSSLPYNLNYQKEISVSQSVDGEDSKELRSLQELEKSFCCSYDLSRSLQRQLLDASPPVSIAFEDLLIERLVDYLCKSGIDTNNDVVRLFVPHLHRVFESATFTDRQIAQTLLRLSCLVRDRRMSLTVSINGAAVQSSRLIPILSQLCDTVISIDSFAGRSGALPYEFKEFVGFFAVKKIQQLGCLAAYRPPHDRYGIKRNRRKLVIEPLHLPPEESRAFGQAGTDEYLKARADALSAGKINGKAETMVPTPAMMRGDAKIQLRIEDDAALAPTQMGEIKKRGLAESLAAARANRQVLKAEGKGPPLAQGSCASNSLDF